MHFAGLTTAMLLQAGAVLAGLVVVFYILKLKRRPIAIPFSPLWQKILRDKEATSLFSQLKRLLSLLLQLALVTLMLLALGDPRPLITRHEGRHLVVLIDCSASMKAIDVPQPAGAGSEDGPAFHTRLDVAKERVRDIIRGLGGQDRIIVAQMDAAVTPLSTMTAEIAQLEEALEAVSARDVRADYARSLRFAVDSLHGLSSPEIVVVSDGALGQPADGTGAVDLGDIDLTYIKIGESDVNVAISAFSVRRYPLDKSRYEVLLEVTNTSATPVDIDLELYGDGEVTDIVGLHLAAEETLSRFYPNMSGADHALEARVKLKGDMSDQLPADDRAYALLPERRRARVQVVTKGNMYLEAALLLDEYLEVVTTPPSEYPKQGESFDVTIFDGVAPAIAEGSGHLWYLDPPDDTHTPFKLGKKLESSKSYALGFDEIDDKHPLMRHLALGDVNVASARALEAGDGDKAVGRSFDGTLLLTGRRQGQKFVALGFDIRNSDLPLRVAWPLLLLNGITYFLEEDVDYISSFQTGQVWSIPADAAAKVGRITLPNGEQQVVPIKDGRAVFLGQHAGFYQLTTGEADSEGEALGFAANLSDRAESAIAPMDELDVGGKKGGEISGFEIGVRRDLWVYLLVAVVLVTALEWFTYHRRVTV